MGVGSQEIADVDKNIQKQLCQESRSGPNGAYLAQLSQLVFKKDYFSGLDAMKCLKNGRVELQKGLW